MKTYERQMEFQERKRDLQLRRRARNVLLFVLVAALLAIVAYRWG